MTTLEKKRIDNLEREVDALRSVVYSIIPLDDEGEYKPSFLRSVRRAMKKPPVGAYAGPGSLLAQLKRRRI